jgi:hypothetical protein
MTKKMTRESSLSIRDNIDRLTGRERTREDDPSYELQNLVVASYALINSGLSPAELGRQFADRKIGSTSASRSNLERKWLSGKSLPGKRKAKELEEVAPDISELRGHAVFTLMRDQPLSIKTIDKCLTRYVPATRVVGYSWCFPDEKERLANKTLVATMLPGDSASLIHRRDLDGFTVILGLVRRAEALGHTDNHMQYMGDLYRSLPAVAEIPWFRKHRRLLATCIEKIHTRDWLSFVLLHARWDQIYDLTRKHVAADFDLPEKSSLAWRLRQEEGKDVVQMADVIAPDVCTLPEWKLGRSRRGGRARPPRPKPRTNRKPRGD